MSDRPPGTAVCPKCKGRGYVGGRYAKRHAFELRPQRIAWLLAHPDAWQEWKGKSKDWRARQIVEDMRVSGLIAQSTNWRDVNLDALIKDATSKKPSMGREGQPTCKEEVCL